MQHELVEVMGQRIRLELKGLCADQFHSVHRNMSKSALANFSIVPVFEELHQHAPLLTSILMKSCPARKSEKDKKVAVTVTMSMLMKFRNPKMKLMASIFSLVLQAGHAGWQICKKNEQLRCNIICDPI